MEGFYFYWISWCAWIFVTFILAKDNRIRYPLAFIVLTTISLSAWMLEPFGIKISAAGLFLLFVCYMTFVIHNTSSLLYLTFSVFSLTILATSFYLLTLYDPIWVLIDQGVVQSFLFTILAFICYRDLITRLAATTCSLIQGDLLYSIILQQLYLEYPAVSFLFLDRLALTGLALVGWNGLEQAIFLLNHQRSIKKEKQM